MGIRHYKKISELEAITSASLGTYVAGVDNGQTVRITLDVLASGVRDTINTLDIQRLNSLENETSSYITSLNGTISGSSQLTSAFDDRYTLSGSVQQITLPSNLISSSTQISAYGFVSESVNIDSLNSFTASQQILNIAFSNGVNARLQTSSFNDFSASIHTEILAATNEQSFNGLISASQQILELGFATTESNSFNGDQTITGSVIAEYNVSAGGYVQTPLLYNGGPMEIRSYYSPLEVNTNHAGINLNDNVLVRGNEIVSGSLSVYIPNTATGANENPTSNNVFWSYVPNDTNTPAVQIGWTAEVVGIGTYTVTNVQVDTPYHPFISITLSDGGLTLPYRCTINFSSQSYLWKFNETGGLVFPDSSSQYTAFTGIPTGTISGSSQLTNLGFATTGSNTFNGNQWVNGYIIVGDNGQSSIDYRDGGSSLYLSANNDITLFTNNGNIVLNADGNVYRGSATAGNGMVTDGYLDSIIGDTSIINNGTGHTITDNLGYLSSSFDSRLHSLEGYVDVDNYVATSSFNNYTASISTASLVDRLNNLETNTGSYETIGRGIISGSSQLTSSYDNRYILSGSISSVPLGTISSSAQITTLGFVSGSYETTGRGILSGSISYTTLINVPSGIISQSIDLTSLNSFTSSYYTTSQSFDSRISSLVSAGVPTGTISGSSQLTASFDVRYTLSGAVQPLPNGLVSSSTQIDGFETTGRGIISSSQQLPINIISGSAQITSYGFISQSTDITSLNTFTASYFTDSSSINTKLVALINNTGSYETTGRGIISQSVVTISDTQPSTGIGNLWYDSNNGNMYLHYDTNTWVDTSNGVIQTIINDGSLLSTASFNAWTASYTASVPNGTISSSAQLPSGLISGSSQLPNGLVSSSAQITALGFISSSTSVDLTSLNNFTSSYSTGSFTGSFSGSFKGNLNGQASQANTTLINNASTNTDYAMVFTTAGSNGYLSLNTDAFGGTYWNPSTNKMALSGSLDISSSFTASLTNGYVWVGNGLNRSYEFATASLLSTASFNTWTGSSYNVLSASLSAFSQSAQATDLQTSASIATLQASLGATSTAFSFTNVTNPTNLVLVSYPTASFNGGVIDILGVNNSNGTATSTNYQFASYGANSGISQNGKQTSGAGAPNLAPSMALSGGNMTIIVTLSGTFNIKGVARLF